MTRKRLFKRASTSAPRAETRSQHSEFPWAQMTALKDVKALDPPPRARKCRKLRVDISSLHNIWCLTGKQLRAMLFGSSKTFRLKHPVILLRGYGTDVADPRSETWRPVEDHLRDIGIAFTVPYCHRFGSIKERADFAIDSIRSAYPSRKVHLIGHSMGGLVAREIAGRETLPFQVLTVTTLGSPNHGIKYIIPVPGQGGHGNTAIATAIRGLFGSDFGALADLSYHAVKHFNANTRNNPAVKYYSWAGHVPRSTLATIPEFLPLLPLVAAAYDKSDGIVGVKSAMWDPGDMGPGIHLGTERLITHSTIVSIDVIVRTLPYLKKAERLRAGVARKINVLVTRLDAFASAHKPSLGHIKLRFGRGEAIVGAANGNEDGHTHK